MPLLAGVEMVIAPFDFEKGVAKVICRSESLTSMADSAASSGFCGVEKPTENPALLAVPPRVVTVTDPSLAPTGTKALMLVALITW